MNKGINIILDALSKRGLCSNNRLKTHNPIKWRFTAKKEGVNKYSVNMTAFMKSPWHIYTAIKP